MLPIISSGNPTIIVSPQGAVYATLIPEDIEKIRQLVREECQKHFWLPESTIASIKYLCGHEVTLNGPMILKAFTCPTCTYG